MNYRQIIFDKYRTVQAFPSQPDLAVVDRWGRAFDTYLAGWLPTDKCASIVDVGCGAGGLLRFFKRHSYLNVKGVDISGEQLAVAKNICEDVYLEGAIEYLAARSNSFDLIVSLDLIEHLHKDELLEFLLAAHAALRPGGRLILQTPNCASPFGITQRYGDFTHEIGLTPNSLAWLLRLTEFEDIQTREQGPVAHGLKSSFRYILWRVMRFSLFLFDLVETGKSKGIYTRVFIISAVKPIS